MEGLSLLLASWPWEIPPLHSEPLSHLSVRKVISLHFRFMVRTHGIYGIIIQQWVLWDILWINGLLLLGAQVSLWASSPSNPALALKEDELKWSAICWASSAQVLQAPDLARDTTGRIYGESGLLLLHSCVDGGRSFPFSRSQFFHLQNGRVETRTVSRSCLAEEQFTMIAPWPLYLKELDSAGLG